MNKFSPDFPDRSRAHGDDDVAVARIAAQMLHDLFKFRQMQGVLTIVFDS